MPKSIHIFHKIKMLRSKGSLTVRTLKRIEPTPFCQIKVTKYLIPACNGPCNETWRRFSKLLISLVPHGIVPSRNIIL